MRVLIAVLLAALLPARAVEAVEPFTVEDIRVEGLQRISAGTVFNYLPIQVGERVDDERIAEAVRALFETGFFEDVRIAREGNVLVAVVEERPSIANIDVSGNKSIETEQLLDGLKQIGLAEGRVFNRSLLDKVEQELRRQYFGRGKYAVQIETTVTPLERNRVDIAIDIAEGRVATIRQIRIVGNDDFDDETLLDEFQLGTPTLFSFWTHNDRYSKQKLQADLETLRSFYLNRGYINFSIDSTQVSLTPDKKDIYITVNVTEGERYTVSDTEMAGDLVVPEEELRKLVTIEPGDVFSRERISESTQAISDRLGNEGYAFANINTIPELDKEKREVSLTFFVDPGKRVYVRRVNFSGNYRTEDEVLRREVRQMESGWFSTEKVKLSRQRLNRLGFFEEVNVETPAVPGSTDQVDVNFSVTERRSGSLQVGVGYGQTSGVLLNASVVQNNVLGTGKRLSLTANTSDVSTVYDFSWTNPYYTINGVSRTLGLTYRRTDAEEANLSEWTLDTANGRISYGVPLAEFDTFRFGFEAEQTEIKLGSNPPVTVTDFVAERDNRFNLGKFTTSWTRDTRNKVIFTTSGLVSRVFGEVAGGDLSFYKVGYRYEQFFSLTDWMTFSPSMEVAFGEGFGDTGGLPFFENFYAGGSRSVRGYEDNTLGPRDPLTDDPIGGNLRTVGSLELLFPAPGDLGKQMRLSAFVDAGNVYDTTSETFDFEAGELRYSAGVGILWLTPVGALRFSVAQPLNEKPEDDTQAFQFSLGSPF
ncbi:MAG: outer membrane protein assembly factor BamA [Gammaproteobacteria bacterium]|nr:outer membrane protein assembly factor BamA [Gammaproteobacteria bacterium]NIR85422.1 outer membrane protein assembly factor BamA [Gammaproteobacteria bacterium]NIR89349.1 outer membrane protein assembly factor BamA [Gammaproteobacteria bacterium]NIU02806.1 outer membrane protein assembly factor BamA [Gammaproteobacteria bacterium]NIV50330.1 outer membrane protein assembly factor BamA [Gammaproteobacteria bacterium]